MRTGTEDRVGAERVPRRDCNYNRSSARAKRSPQTSRATRRKTAREQTDSFTVGGRVASHVAATTHGRSLAKPEQHRARERSLRRRQGVEQSERQPAGPAQEREVVAEEVDETVRERDAGPAVGPPAARVALEHRPIADRLARRVDDRPRELERVAQPHVETLARDRMQRLRGVAEDDGARADRRARELENERKRAAPFDPLGANAERREMD